MPEKNCISLEMERKRIFTHHTISLSEPLDVLWVM